MKIAVDLVKAAQEWDPNTGEQSNYLLLSFAGKQFRVQVSEEEMQYFLAEAVTSAQEPASMQTVYNQSQTIHSQNQGIELASEVDDYYGPSDEQFVVGGIDEFDVEDTGEPLEEVIYDGTTGDKVFGGDVESTVEPPTLFNTEELPEVEDDRPEPPPSSQQQRRQQIRKVQDARDTASLKEKKLRQRAKKVPMRRVPADEAGYPEQSAVASIARSKGVVAERTPPRAPQGPEVRQTHVSEAFDGDEDGFEQG